MREELHRFLDGELAEQELPEELRAEARAWEAFLTEVRGLGPAGAPADLESRVVRAILASPPTPVWRRAWKWWVSPRPVRVAPLAGLAAAAVVALAVLLPRTGGPTAGPPIGPAALTGAAGTSVQSVYVQFLLDAPAASSVSLAGDFTDWTPQVELQDLDGDGIWTALVPLTPGVHEYMFVVDGSTWVTDPYAERYADDGFGNRNAVLAIATPQSSGI
ncbi:MAG: glycoside hydrolase family 13 [Gemmatimonadota bacterium]